TRRSSPPLRRVLESVPKAQKPPSWIRRWSGISTRAGRREDRGQSGTPREQRWTRDANVRGTRLWGVHAGGADRGACRTIRRRDRDGVLRLAGRARREGRLL